MIMKKILIGLWAKVHQLLPTRSVTVLSIYWMYMYLLLNIQGKKKTSFF